MMRFCNLKVGWESELGSNSLIPQLEQDRLDLSHALMTKGIGDKLFLAPIDTKKMHRVLDIGTGTGICTIFGKNSYTTARAY